jgi:hypothetical protein
LGAAPPLLKWLTQALVKAAVRGGYIDAIITSPASSYSYQVGAGGTSGTAGTSGYVGGAGGSGIIIVEEYYQ